MNASPTSRLISATAVSFIAGGRCGGRSFETGDLSAADRTPDRRRASHPDSTPAQPPPTTAELRPSCRDPRDLRHPYGETYFSPGCFHSSYILNASSFRRKRHSPGESGNVNRGAAGELFGFLKFRNGPLVFCAGQSVPFDIALGQIRYSTRASYDTAPPRRQLAARNSSDAPSTCS